MVKWRPSPGQILVEGLTTTWALPSSRHFHHWVPHGFIPCVLGWKEKPLGGASGRQGRVWKPEVPHALLYQVLLLCQEGGLKLALNGQGVGATSLGQQVLEQLRELRISGSVQLYCVHY